MGKTSFALSIVSNAICQQDKPVLYFTMESSSRTLVTRLLASVSEIEYRSLRSGDLSERDRQRFDSALEKLGSKNLYVDDSSSLKIQDVYRNSLRVKDAHDDQLALIVIDYIQLMDVSETAESKGAVLDGNVRSLKRIARELCCPVLVLSQINRRVDSRANRRPRMSDLRDTGALEDEADLILMLYRSHCYRLFDTRELREDDVAEVIVLKNANDPQGIARLHFKGRFFRFENKYDK